MDRITKKIIVTVIGMVMLTAILSTSCSNSKTKEVSLPDYSALWKALTESDWASWGGTTGCEMKFIGKNNVVVMEWMKDPVNQGWKRTFTRIDTVEFLDDKWFLIRNKANLMACMFVISENTFETSNGDIFRKSQINAFRTRSK